MNLSRPFPLVVTLLVTSAIPLSASAQTTQPSQTPEVIAETGNDVPQNSIKKGGRFGVGLEFGTGTWPLSAKYFVTDSFSIQASGPFWGFFGFGLGLSTDALYEPPIFYSNKAFSLSWQLGGGLGFFWYNYKSDRVENYTGSFIAFEAHPNVGFQLLLNEYPIDIVFEYRPYITVTNFSRENSPKTDKPASNTQVYLRWAGFGLHARYYF